MLKEDDQYLSPNSSPSELGRKAGVRRVNNMPVFIIIAVVIAFLIVMGMEAYSRSEAQESQSSEISNKQTDSYVLAESVAGTQHNGIIEPEKISTPIVAIASTDSPPQVKTIDTPNPDDAKIMESKAQAFENAIRSKTSIQLAPATINPSQKEAMVNKIEDAKAQIANLQNTDPNAAYQLASNQLPNSTKSTYNKFDTNGKTDRWELNSNVEAPKTDYVLRAGFVIPASMISGINSDLPGQIIGQVSQNVYDTATGKYLIIPQGTRLVGSYSSEVAYGQSRILIAWQRLVFPDGKAMDIGAMPGADGVGYSGLTDQVDSHYLRIFGSAFLMSGITAGVAYSQNSNNNSGIYGQQNASSALSEALGQQLGNTSSQFISKNLNISPTLEVRPGFRFNVMVVKDLNFTKPYQSFDY